MPCKPLDISNVQPPDTPSFSGPVGKPFTPILDKLSSEDKPKQIDLQELYDILQYIVPPGVQVKTVQSKNYGQDAFDFILGLIDKVYPFLLLYNFFLPLLNIIICIIEVLCAIPDPFKTVDALIHLFRDCIPAFLALFPIFALAIMIISLCLLLLALIEYIYLKQTNTPSTLTHCIKSLYFLTF